MPTETARQNAIATHILKDPFARKRLVAALKNTAAVTEINRIGDRVDNRVHQLQVGTQSVFGLAPGLDLVAALLFQLFVLGALSLGGAAYSRQTSSQMVAFVKKPARCRGQ